MGDNASGQPWLAFRIAGDTGAGVDARALAKLLTDIMNAARIIAREKLSLDTRRGPMSSQERALAGFRVTSVAPGSVNIAFAAPPAQQAVMSLDEEVTPGAVARELIGDLESFLQNQSLGSRGYRRRQAVESVIRSAARIGRSAEIVHYAPGDEPMRVHLALPFNAVVYQEVMESRDIRERVMFGQVFMADVEDGRQRVRVKLANESDITMRLQEDLANDMSSVLGQLAELHVSEVVVGGTVVERVVGDVRLLATDERGIEVPSKSIDELAREQGLLWRSRPDYVSILSGLWESEEEAEEFRDDIQSRRAVL